MSSSVKHLDVDCAKKIRHGQVITKILDVVRELVDNSVDGGAKSIQVLLDNFGLKRIEVKDNGAGILAKDIPLLFQGGYTSKLDNDAHLSCNDQYGFRGEALSAICALSGIVVKTKTAEDATGRSFVLDKWGRVTAENVAPIGNGTVITVRDLFQDYPVRQKHSSEAKVQRGQLKDIEFYMKCLGIANPGVYFSLYHNGNLIWSKPSVKNTEQALTTILGVALAKNLSACISEELIPDSKETEEESSWRGSIEMYVPKKPVDFRSMGFTSSKMTMIFVNRRLVHASDYQQLIKRYCIGGAENPTQQEQRKFPLAVVIINVPPSEVDFNRETDKSKVFLTCHELVTNKLEVMLQSFYSINLDVLGEGHLTSELSVSHNDTSDLNISSNSSKENSLLDFPDEPGRTSAHIKEFTQSSCLLKRLSSTPEKRQENISSFLGNLPSAGSFSSLRPFDHQQRHISPSPNKARFPTSDFTVSTGTDTSTTTPRDPRSHISSNNGIQASAEPLSITLDESGGLLDIHSAPGDHANPRSIREKRSIADTAMEEEMRNPSDHLRDAPVRADDFQENPIMDVDGPIGMDWSFGGGPQCGAVIHNEMVRSGDRRPRRIHDILHEPKRVRLLDTSFESNSSGGSQSSSGRKQQRQVKLDFSKYTRTSFAKQTPDYASRECTPERSVASLLSRPVKITEEMIPRTMEYLREKELTRETREVVNSTDAPKYSTTLGINVSISVSNLRQRRNVRSLEPSETSGAMQVIKNLEGTPYYIVKIDGLLGIFNCEKFKDIRPSLLMVSSSNENPSPAMLLQEFSNNAESIDETIASSVFQVMADLDELESGSNLQGDCLF